MAASGADVPPPALLRHLILEGLSEPTVFHGLLSDWALLGWGLGDWVKRLGSKVLPFRSGEKKATQTPQWERSCTVEQLTMEQFVERQSGTDRWLYFDYKHMHEWFMDNPDILTAVNWGRLGFPERGGADSTLWIGSDGAHTPCHMDTYGCNLVAQVYGMKQWLLFPPETTAKLLPTRVPYEESSIYSKHNFYCPDVSLANRLEGARTVTLHPGDVLFVPRHWWHYVENTGSAISINTWIPLPSDDESRLEEALVQMFVSQVCRTAPQRERLLNPNEDDLESCSLAHSLMLVETCAENCYQPVVQKTREESPLTKKAKTDYGAGDRCLTQYTHVFNVIPECSSAQLEVLFSAKRERFLCDSTTDSVLKDEVMEQLINAFCHPEVISHVKDIFCQQYKSGLGTESSRTSK